MENDCFKALYLQKPFKEHKYSSLDIIKKIHKFQIKKQVSLVNIKNMLTNIRSLLCSSIPLIHYENGINFKMLVQSWVLIGVI